MRRKYGISFITNSRLGENRRTLFFNKTDMSYSCNWSPWEAGYKSTKFFDASSFVSGKNLDITQDERGLTLARAPQKVFNSDARVSCMFSLSVFDTLSLDTSGNIYFNDIKKFTLTTTATNHNFIGVSVFGDWLLLFTTEAMHRILYLDVLMENINSSTVQQDYFKFPSAPYAYRALLNKGDEIFYFGCGNALWAFDKNFSLYTPLTLEKNDNIVGMSQIGGNIRIYTFQEYPCLSGKVHIWDGKSATTSQTIAWSGSPVRSIIPMGKYDLATTGLRFSNTYLSAMAGYDNSAIALLPLVGEPYSASQATSRLYLGTTDGVYMQKTLRSGQTVLLPYTATTSENIAIDGGHISAILSNENGFLYSIEQANPVGPRVESVKIWSGPFATSGMVESGLFSPRGSCQRAIIKRVRLACSGESGASVKVWMRPQQQEEWVLVGTTRCDGTWRCDEFCPSGLSGNGFFIRLEMLSNDEKTASPSIYGFEAVCEDIF